jgi:hypothetical protein
MDVVRPGRRHTLSPNPEAVCAELSALTAGWTRNVIFALLRYDEARQLDQKVDSWMLLAENAPLGAHTIICENGPVLPKEPSTDA